MVEPVFFVGSARRTSVERAQRLTSLPMPVPDASDLSFAEACRDAALEVFPQAGEMYEGFLEGGGWEPNAFFTYFFARKQGLLRGCTNFAVLPSATADGEAIDKGKTDFP